MLRSVNPLNKLSRRALLHVLAFCGLPTHLWTIYNMLRDVPSWILYMDLWDLIGTVAYTLTFALLETLALFVLLVLAGWLLPKRWLRGNFAPLSFAFVLEAVVMALVIHDNDKLLWNMGLLVKIFAGGFAALAALVYAVPKIKAWVDWLGERIAVLVYLYLALDVLAVLIVVIRNI